MKKILLINIFLLLLSAVCLAQDKTRIIGFPEEVKSGDFQKDENQRTIPCSVGVEIVEIKIKDQVITLDNSFIYEDDWLKYLTIRLKNISGKPISYISIIFHQPQTVYNGGRSSIGFMMKFGKQLWESTSNEIKSIQPNEEIELSRNEKVICWIHHI